MFSLNIIKELSSKWVWLGAATLLVITSCSPISGDVDSETAVEIEAPPNREAADKYADYTIVTLLPRDAIPAIDNPQFLQPGAADEFYDPDELIIGVEFEGNARAYSVPFLSNHEIVNDTVGGRKIAITW